MFLLDTDHIGILQRRTQPEYGRLVQNMGGKGFIVLTRNLKDFNQVPGLKVEDWTI
jgi:hypothetical protein